MSDQEAQYARNLERVRALSYQSAANDTPSERTTPSKPLPTLDSGLQRNGKPANDGGISLNPLKSVRSLFGGGAANNNQETLPGGATTDTVANAVVPGGNIIGLWNKDLPPMLRIMVAGKEFTRPGGIMLLWPLLSLPYCLFGWGTIFFWMLQPRKQDGNEVKLADIKMGIIDFGILGLTTAIWGLILLFFVAIVGAVAK